MTRTVSLTLEAAHRRPELPTWHACHGLHGHYWEITVTATSGRGWTDAEIDRLYTAEGDLRRTLDSLATRDLATVPALRDLAGDGSIDVETVVAWIVQLLRPHVPTLTSVRVSTQHLQSLATGPDMAVTTLPAPAPARR